MISKSIVIKNPEDLFQLSPYDQKNTLFIAFCNNRNLINSLQNFIKEGNIIGSSNYHSISGEELVSPDFLTVGILNFKNTKVKTSFSEIPNYEGSEEAGIKLMQDLNIDGLAGVILLTKGLNIDGLRFSNGINSANLKSVPIIGGFAADNLNFSDTFVFNNKIISSSGCIGAALIGNSVSLEINSKAGLKSFGVERKITKSHKNIIQEIDGKPALDVYEKYIGKDFSTSAAESYFFFPFEIGKDLNFKSGVVRTPLKLHAETKSIEVVSEVPEMSFLRLMITSPEELIMAAEEVNDSNSNLQNSFSLIISCAARKALMGEQTAMEIPKNRESQVGFYSYGEFTFLDNQCTIVNQTFTQGIIHERI